MLWIRISIRARCTTLCDKVCQRLSTWRWFSPGPPVSSTDKTDRHDITEIFLKVALNSIIQTNIKRVPIIYCNFKERGKERMTWGKCFLTSSKDWMASCMVSICSKVFWNVPFLQLFSLTAIYTILSLIIANYKWIYICRLFDHVIIIIKTSTQMIQIINIYVFQNWRRRKFVLMV